MQNKYVLVISCCHISFFVFKRCEGSASKSSFIVGCDHFNSFCFVAPFRTTMKMTILILLCFHAEKNGGSAHRNDAMLLSHEE